MLAAGRYDSYIRTVDTRDQRPVVDLVQLFRYPASVDAASDLQTDLLPGDCIESRNHQLAKLIKDSRATPGSTACRW